MRRSAKAPKRELRIRPKMQGLVDEILRFGQVAHFKLHAGLLREQPSELIAIAGRRSAARFLKEFERSLGIAEQIAEDGRLGESETVSGAKIENPLSIALRFGIIAEGHIHVNEQPPTGEVVRNFVVQVFRKD